MLISLANFLELLKGKQVLAVFVPKKTAQFAFGFHGTVRALIR
jgi:hypothetical protein